MTHDPTRPLGSPFQSQSELELLEIVLQELSYPWNPAELGAEAYFTALEQEVIEAGWSTEELAEQGQLLSTRLEQLWTTAVPVSETATHPVFGTALFQRFGSQVPRQLLNGIAQRARQVIDMNLSMTDQLVHCVQEYLPNWGEEDLQVLARPFAYAMRGEEAEVLEMALRSIRSADWAELSSVEQARLSLAIAHYAISQPTISETSSSQMPSDDAAS